MTGPLYRKNTTAKGQLPPNKRGEYVFSLFVPFVTGPYIWLCYY